MRIGGRIKPLKVKKSMTCDSADLLLDMVLAGLGIASLSSILAQASIDRGKLVPLLVDHHVCESFPISAVMPPGRQNLPRVRSLVEFMVEQCGKP